MKNKKNKGFSCVELLIVVAIAAIMTTVIMGMIQVVESKAIGKVRDHALLYEQLDDDIEGILSEGR